jgi:hypothetical protein
LKNFFLAKEIWSLADPNSSDKTRLGTPVSLMHSMLRIFFANDGVDWKPFLLGGVLGKTITEAHQQRVDGGEKPPSGKVHQNGV